MFLRPSLSPRASWDLRLAFGSQVLGSNCSEEIEITRVTTPDGEPRSSPKLPTVYGMKNKNWWFSNHDRRKAHLKAVVLRAQREMQGGRNDSRSCLWWDVPELRSLPEVNGAIRVVHSEESWKVKRQLTKQLTLQTTNWLWPTAFSGTQERTEPIMRLRRC